MLEVDSNNFFLVLDAYKLSQENLEFSPVGTQNILPRWIYFMFCVLPGQRACVACIGRGGSGGKVSAVVVASWG